MIASLSKSLTSNLKLDESVDLNRSETTKSSDDFLSYLKKESDALQRKIDSVESRIKHEDKNARHSHDQNREDEQNRIIEKERSEAQQKQETENSNQANTDKVQKNTEEKKTENDKTEKPFKTEKAKEQTESDTLKAEIAEKTNKQLNESLESESAKVLFVKETEKTQENGNPKETKLTAEKASEVTFFQALKKDLKTETARSSQIITDDQKQPLVHKNPYSREKSQSEADTKKFVLEAVKNQDSQNISKLLTPKDQSPDARQTAEKATSGDNKSVRFFDSNWSVAGKVTEAHQQSFQQGEKESGNRKGKENTSAQIQNLNNNQSASGIVTDKPVSFFEEALRNQSQAKAESQMKPAFEGLVEKARVNLGSNGTSTAMIRLNPEEMGRMLLDLKMKGNQLTANVVVETPAAMKKLKEDLELLKFELQQKGLQVESIQIKLRESFEAFTNKDPSQQFSSAKGENQSSENSEYSDTSNEGNAKPGISEAYEESEFVLEDRALHEGKINLAV